MERKGDWIQTVSGKQFWPLDPRSEDIDIADIAHALSQICRWTGHCRKFYSVAQHCVLVSQRAEILAQGTDKLTVLRAAQTGLLHDASEAYIADVARPVKLLPEFEVYRRIEKNLQGAIYTKFGLPTGEPEVVHRADNELLFTEARDLMGKDRPNWKGQVEPLAATIVPMFPEEARELFLSRYLELFS